MSLLKGQILIITLFICLFSLTFSQRTEQEVRCNNCGYGGTAVYHGQLIIKYNNQWRSVCSTNFNQGAGNLGCQSAFGPGSTMISFNGNAQCNIPRFWLDNLQCDGTEDNLLNCNHNGFGTHSCSESQCVEIVCSRTTNIIVQTRLELGILQIQYQNEWRYVCDDSFDQQDADVACKSLQGPNFRATQIFTGQFCEGLNIVDFWLDDLGCTGEENNLAQCQGYSGWGFHDCGANECVRIACEELQAPEVSTLVHGSQGILSLTFRGETRAICDDAWGETDSSIACKELYGNPDFYSYTTAETCDYSNFWLDNIACSGNELKIEECSHNDWGVHDCSNQECIQLFCVGGGPEAPYIVPEVDGRLIQNQETGILSFTFRQQVQGICDDGFSNQGASVACYELYGNRQVTHFEIGQRCDYEDFWLDDVLCNGNEESIRNCPHTAYGNHDCNPDFECIALFCQGGGPIYVSDEPTPIPVDGQLSAHLVHSNEGILSVTYQGETRAICDDGFSQEDAEVSCYELYGERNVISYYIGRQCNYENFWLDDVVCLGTEYRIQECNHRRFGQHDCNWRTECVQLYCRGGGPQTATELLIHHEGNLQILRENEIRSVCDHQFNDFAAENACYSMYGTYEVLSYSTGQSCHAQNFWVDNIVCNSRAPTLSACNHDPFGQVDNCDPSSNCIVIYCQGYGPQPPENQQIVGYAEHNQVTGILNYNYNGQSRAVCDDGFSNNQAEVACYELYQNQNVLSYSQGHRCDYQDFWLDDIACDPDDWTLGNCSHLPYGNHNCNPDYECVELFCEGGGPRPQEEIIVITEEHEYRLTQSITGLISINVDGVNGNICQNGFDNNAANVVCYQIYGVPAQTFEIGFRCQYDNFWLNELSCSGNENNLHACGHQPVEEIECDHNSECVQVFCQGRGPQSPGTTLVQGETGSLGINRNRETRSICDDGFNDYSAETACQELYGVHYVSFQTGQNCEFQGFWLDDVICSGNETRIVDCQHGVWGIHDCSSQECVQLVCGNHQGYQPNDPEPEVILVHNQTSGVLSISRNGIIEGVCDDGFTMESAQVACQELYNNPQVIQYISAVRCDHADFWLDDVQCNGQETRLKDCQHLNWGVHNCDWQTECLQLYCAGGGPVIVPEVVDIVVPQARLQHGINGILSITYQDQTKAVCDDGWSQEDSDIACRELYGIGVTAQSFSIGHQCNYEEFWLDQVVCTGRENSIQECDHNEFGNHDCNWQTECVQLFCVLNGPVSDEAHLIHSYNGVLNILYNGQIRSVGGTNFDAQSASTACKELYNVTEVLDFHTGVECVYENFWTDNIQCTNGEECIAFCTHDAWGETTLTDGENCVAVFCQGYGPQPEGHAEADQGILVHNTNLGLLNYFYNNELRAICDHGFTLQTAEVACNELYGHPQVRFFQTGQECEHPEFWLDEVQCDGEESFIVQCPHLPFGVNNCESNSNCVNLFCQYGGPEGQVIDQRVVVIVPGQQEDREQSYLRVNSNGILQITFRGETRAICDDQFNEVSGLVACRELYGDDSTVVELQGGAQCVDDDFWLDNVQCDGEELTIEECSHNDWGVHDCGQTECIQLFCTEGGPEPDTAPLVHGNTGILNVLYNDQIKSICDDGFNVFAAETACNELYGNPEIVTFRIGQQCDYQDFWLDNVDCTERGSKLTKCQHSPFGVHDCNPQSECILLQCAAQPIVSPAPVPPVPVQIHVVHNQQTGVLSISKDGDVRAICGNVWTDENSQITCNQLYGDSNFVRYEIGHACDFQQFWLDEVSCSGTENRLSDCAHNDWGTAQCNPAFECVALYCVRGGPQPPRGQVIQNPITGVISITYERETRSLCDDGFTETSAQVICNELYGNPTIEQFFTSQQCDFEDFWLDNVLCQGNEQLLDQCQHNAYGLHDCNYRYECVKVYCTHGGPQIPRGSLVHSQTAILTINYNGQVKSVADTGFGDNEARTACLELYQNPNFVLYRTSEPCQINSFWIDSIQCQEGQVTIDSCQHTQYGEVSTRTTINSCVELYCEVGGPQVPRGYLVHNQTTGILNIRYRSLIQSVCHDGFSDHDAEVACKELYGSIVFIAYQVGQTCEFQEFWLDDVNCDGSENYLQDCPHARWGINNCHPSSSCVQLFCRAGGPQPFNPPVITHSLNGILSMTYNGVAKAICDDQFDELSAAVACYELYGSYQFNSYTLGHECDYEDFWADDIQCVGTETSIWQCPQAHLGQHDCADDECVQLFCTGNGPQQIFVQFVHDPQNAIISVDRNGELKAICDDGFTIENARVFCQSMYNDPTVIQSTQGQNCGSLTDFWLDDVSCDGNEVSLLQCSHSAWGIHNCNPAYECQQIYCAGGGPVPPSHLTQSSQGILSITYFGQTKALCDFNFNDQTAQVACNELFGSPEVVSYSHGHSCVYEDFWLSNVVCLGGEPKVQDCNHNNWGEHNCNSQNNCVKLFCFGGGAQPVTGRLVHSNTTGILSFTHESVTKAICDDGFGMNEASVACLELYGNSQVISVQQGFNCDYDEFWLDDVQCRGTERLLGDCVHLPYGEHNCNPRTECIRLVCSQGGYRPEELQVVLTHGADASLNVIYNYELKGVCDSRFNDFSANVACRELYGDPVFLRWSGEHACTHQGFWLDNVQCSGNENHLSDCSHSPIGQNNCNDNQCIKLYCRAGGPRVDESPLVHSQYGILSILHEGSIKAVCDDVFNDVSARVACSELYSNPNVINYEIGQSCDYNEFWLDNIQCNGGETRISDCIHNIWGNHDCNYQTECIRLSCEGGGYGSHDQDQIASLVHNTTSGILSLTFRTETRAVCDDYFNDADASVACNELYGNPNFLQYRIGLPCDYNDFWTDDVICQGDEQTLSQCQHTAWGTHNCNPNYECVQLICQEAGPELEGNGTLSLTSNHILTITYNGETRSVCDDGFNEQNAQIACLELTGDPTVSVFSGGHECQQQDFWLDDVVCRGDETLLQDCFHRRWGKHDCNPEYECIELYCGTATVPVIELRHNPETAIISLSIDDVEQGICDDGFSESDAQVICNQLYGSPNVLSFEQGHNCNLEGFWLDDVNCNGQETNVLSCYHNPLGVHNCNPQTECVQLYCQDGGPQPTARLTHNIRGILSIAYQGETRSLCGNGFTDNSAHIACLELYANPEFVSYTVGHECQYQQFWIDRVVCEGTEITIQQCQHSPFGQAHCNPDSDCVQIYCAGGGPSEELVYVVQNIETGILSIEYEGVEKAFCQHQFNQQTAEVVCRQLYGRQASVLSFSHGNACDYEDFWLDDVVCRGDESTIAQCNHSPFGEHNCDHTNECVQLFCSSGPQPPNIQPPLLTQNGNGILTITYNNQNGNLCDNGFDNIAAEVACHELFNSSQVLHFNTGEPCPYEQFWLDDLQCNGTEENLMSCNHRQLGTNNCNINQCVRLYCYGGGVEMNRVADESTLIHGANGILSVEYRGEVRSICDDGFSEYGAQVACNQLYGDSHVFSYTQQEPCDYDGFWLDDVVCNGNEIALQQCPHTAWGIHNCNSQNSCIRLYCSAGGPSPTPVTPPTPITPEPQCVILYSGCGYSGESRQICGDLEVELSEEEVGWQVMCIKIPEDYTVRIFDNHDQFNGEIDVTQSIPCLNQVQGVDVEESERKSHKQLSFALKSKKITKNKKNLLRKNRK